MLDFHQNLWRNCRRVWGCSIFCHCIRGSWTFFGTDVRRFIMVLLFRLMNRRRLLLSIWSKESWRVVDSNCSCNRCNPGSWDRHSLLMILTCLSKWCPSLRISCFSSYLSCAFLINMGEYFQYYFVLSKVQVKRWRLLFLKEMTCI